MYVWLLVRLLCIIMCISWYVQFITSTMRAMNNIKRELLIPVLFSCNMAWNWSLSPVHLLTNTVDVFCIDSRNYFVVFILVFSSWIGFDFLTPLLWELDSRDEAVYWKYCLFTIVHGLSPTYEVRKKEKKTKYYFWKGRRITPCWNESAARRCRRKNTVGR
jgi:hypothetical protein